MIKKKDLSKEDSEVWQSYIKNPTDVYDKDLRNKSINRKAQVILDKLKHFFAYTLFR